MHPRQTVGRDRGRKAPPRPASVARAGGLALLTLAPLFAAAKPGQSTVPDATSAKEKLMAHVKGIFDMSKNPRPYIVFLILDQENNRYPSFWCGRNAGGTIRFTGGTDVLEDKVEVKHAGSFTVQLTNAARKLGMFGIVPAGEWAETLRDRNFRITLEAFRDAVLSEVRTDSSVGTTPATLVTVEARLEGKIGVGDREAPFKGSAAVTFSDRTTGFSLQASFPFPGRELGLPGARGEGITATLFTASCPQTTGLGNDGKSGSGPGGAGLPAAESP